MKRNFVILFFLLSIVIFSRLPRPNITSLPPIPSPTTLPSPNPSPTPKPLTFTQLNALYGPCAVVPTLMYHHITSSDIFKNQLTYLRNRGYTVISMQNLSDFFTSNIPLPQKSVLLTFDDGYQDFADYAAPLLREFNFKATLFLPTGLADNPGYLKWNSVRDIAGAGNILFANHTWSHQQMKTILETITREITTADTQLSSYGLNNPKVFAYPYGTYSQPAADTLTKLGYSLAFTTHPGSILCMKQRLTLPRIRIGNDTLSRYGL